MTRSETTPRLVEVAPPFPTLHFMKGKKRIEGRSWKALSEASGVGASARCWKNRIICTADGQPVAHISFNAKVWAGTEYVAGAEPLYDPYAEAREAERAAYAAESITVEYREV
jgi:hypothetical protein